MSQTAERQMSELFDTTACDAKVFVGDWVPASETVAVHEPATGAVLFQAGVGTPEVVREAAAKAHEAQGRWSALSYIDRADVMRRAGDIAVDFREELVSWVVRESGSVRAKAENEVDSTARELYEAAALPSLAGGRVLPSAVEGRMSLARRIPYGVVGVITPWNFPLLLAVQSVAPALALGNAVVLKPDVNTPASGGLLLARVFELAGLPPHVLQVVPGDGRIGESLVADPDVSLISFTGSTAAGRRVGEVAGRHLKKVHLELGGNNAMIVLADADLEATSSAGAWGSFLHQGQICLSTGRHLVDERIADDYAAALAARANALKVGNPAESDDVNIGPLINQRQLERVQEIVESSVALGARVIAGGDNDALFLTPTVVSDVTLGMPAFDQEIFGPVAPIITFRDHDEAIALANSTEYGLSAAVYTESIATGLEMIDRIRSGMIHLNDQTVNNEPPAPFGGVGQSGNGARLGNEANLEEFAQWQWVTLHGHGRRYPF